MFSSSYYPISHFVPSSAYDHYPASCRHVGERRQLAYHRDLEQRRWQALAQRLRRARYLPDDDCQEDVSGTPHLAYSPIEYPCAERLRSEVEARRHRELKGEQVRQQLEQRRFAENRTKRNYWESLQDCHDHYKRQTGCGPSSLSSSSPLATNCCGSTPAATYSPRHSTPTSKGRSSPRTQLNSLDRSSEAASKIQTAYLVHRAISVIKDVEQQFLALKSSFTFPTAVDYQGPDGVINVSVSDNLFSIPSVSDGPILAFTSVNYDLRAYIEGLDRFLVKLDAVDSRGNTSVRKIRRKVVANVEEEASKVDEFWKQLWAIHVRSMPSDLEVTEDANKSKNGDDGVMVVNSEHSLNQLDAEEDFQTFQGSNGVVEKPEEKAEENVGSVEVSTSLQNQQEAVISQAAEDDEVERMDVGNVSDAEWITPETVEDGSDDGPLESEECKDLDSTTYNHPSDFGENVEGADVNEDFPEIISEEQPDGDIASGVFLLRTTATEGSDLEFEGDGFVVV